MSRKLATDFLSSCMNVYNRLKCVWTFPFFFLSHFKLIVNYISPLFFPFGFFSNSERDSIYFLFKYVEIICQTECFDSQWQKVCKEKQISKCFINRQWFYCTNFVILVKSSPPKCVKLIWSHLDYSFHDFHRTVEWAT